MGKRKRRNKRRGKPELYKIEKQLNYVHYAWYDKDEKPVYDSIETIYREDYAERYFHPYHMMKARNCRLRA